MEFCVLYCISSTEWTVMVWPYRVKPEQYDQTIAKLRPFQEWLYTHTETVFVLTVPVTDTSTDEIMSNGSYQRVREVVHGRFNIKFEMVFLIKGFPGNGYLVDDTNPATSWSTV